MILIFIALMLLCILIKISEPKGDHRPGPDQWRALGYVTIIITLAFIFAALINP